MQPIRYVRLHPDGYSVQYRDREFARLWRSEEGGWVLECDPLGYTVEEWSQRDARRTLRQWIDGGRHWPGVDLRCWWALHAGAKEA